MEGCERPVISLVLACYHYHSCKALRAFLATQPDILVLAETPTGQGAVSLAECWHPDVILMDVHVPHVNAVRATRQIRKRCPGISIVIMTMYEEAAFVAQSAGADACVDISAEPEDIVATIREAVACRTREEQTAPGRKM